MLHTQVLETCVKNCNKRFHVYVAERSFIAALDKFITGKNAVGGMAREKLLGLIQTWADAFRHDMMLASIRELYLKLLGDGVEFPAQNLDEVSPREGLLGLRHISLSRCVCVCVGLWVGCV